MSAFIGIDPSYSRTGLCLLVDGVVAVSESIEVPDVLKTGSIYNIASCMQAASWLGARVGETLRDWCGSVGSGLSGVVVEIPAAQSLPGPYLFLIQQALYAEYPRDVRVWLVSPTAINGMVFPPRKRKPRTKAELAEWTPEPRMSKVAMKAEILRWAKERYGGEDVLSNHDEASAAVLCGIGEQILQGMYKKTYRVLDRVVLEDGGSSVSDPELMLGF